MLDVREMQRIEKGRMKERIKMREKVGCEGELR